jgi:UDP-N-acetylglucosamine--N-acetylmuramyl-(pentapeptide) pyrophosphoryl-undecaprenol N-acetylglucosamine transferase
VLVFGGSLGARTLNRASAEAFAGRSSIGGAFRVLHIAGSREYAELAARELPRGYDLREYLDQDDFADALAAADLAVSRAGGSVFEIAAHGVPAILVPYPHAAADHQSTNARWMADAGAAVVIADAELTGARLGRQLGARRDGRGLARARPPRRRR